MQFFMIGPRCARVAVDPARPWSHRTELCRVSVGCCSVSTPARSASRAVGRSGGAALRAAFGGGSASRCHGAPLAPHRLFNSIPPVHPPILWSCWASPKMEPNTEDSTKRPKPNHQGPELWKPGFQTSVAGLRCQNLVPQPPSLNLRDIWDQKLIPELL